MEKQHVKSLSFIMATIIVLSVLFAFPASAANNGFTATMGFSLDETYYQQIGWTTTEYLTAYCYRGTYLQGTVNSIFFCYTKN